MFVYDASIASLTWFRILFVLPHLMFGSYCLVNSYHRKCNLRGHSEDSTFGIVVQSLFGLIFVGFVIFMYISNGIQTYQCSHAVQAGQTTTITGKVQDSERYGFPSKNFRYEFVIDDKKFVTPIDDPECGFIKPLGNYHKPQVGEQAVIKLFKNKIIYASFSK